MRNVPCSACDSTNTERHWLQEDLLSVFCDNCGLREEITAEEWYRRLLPLTAEKIAELVKALKEA